MNNQPYHNKKTMNFGDTDSEKDRNLNDHFNLKKI